MKKVIKIIFAVTIICFVFGTFVIVKGIFASNYGSSFIEDKESKTNQTTIISKVSSKDNKAISSQNNKNWNLLLANKNNPVPDDYKIVEKEGKDCRSKTFIVDERIYDAFTELVRAAKQDGIQLCVNSAYRSHEEQKQIFDDKKKELMKSGLNEKQAEEETMKSVQIPGRSEHETGLAIDFGFIGKSTWGNAYEWLEKNSYNYGFILRYPVGKTDITGVKNEPWHYRYVGVEDAKKITEQGITLEEYLK